ncbi:hypothetical protein Pmar_PMAR029369 [Perkinsus marinus ATCC 50983]|uniref:Uncharacterized protein n=1 Tax=Perkinsus marinus (strain ATCC 50983 / TXsc) TaxID=423536 RepID=C5KMY6_PERM5|nr:hypothetical protein Pmar_PMAR029369 [Perkinsus marinus ATCC 50983]EER14294.1 hypothetical protein Pmar_PMAR029369 [Perkinsus marinus ATCC 50983]|eukprot:XP_002782499.1 hypothetical protein Pmar_PMAR029369 [Perkinsus marinus ATCC 50983]
MSLPTLEGKINWAAISAEEEDSFVPDVCEVTYAEAAEGVSKLTAKIGKIMESESSRPPGFGFLMDGQGLILPEDSKTIQSVMASDEFTTKDVAMKTLVVKQGASRARTLLKLTRDLSDERDVTRPRRSVPKGGFKAQLMHHAVAATKLVGQDELSNDEENPKSQISVVGANFFDTLAARVVSLSASLTIAEIGVLLAAFSKVGVYHDYMCINPAVLKGLPWMSASESIIIGAFYTKLAEKFELIDEERQILSHCLGEYLIGPTLNL